MSSGSIVYDIFKTGVLTGTFQLNGTDSIYLALVNGYTPSATDGPTWGSGAPSTSEVTGTGYTAGGQSIGTTSVGIVGNVANFALAADVVWSSSTITATGGVLYDTSQGNALIAYVDFGGSQSSSSADFTVSWSSGSYLMVTLT